MSTFQKKLQQDRKNEETANAGLKWSADDDKYLIDSASAKVPLNEIAKYLKRTEGSIKTRLVISAIAKSEKDKVDIVEVCSEYGITQEDVKTYQQKKQNREERRNNQNRQDKSNSFPSGEMAEILQALTMMSNKLDSVIESNKTILKKLDS